MSGLGRVERVVGVFSWVVAAAAVAMLFVGPVVVAEDKPTETAAESDEGGGSSGDGYSGSADEGLDLFAENCGGCHTLEAAGTSGTVGPSLDGAGLDAATVAEIVSEGQGGMPSFADSLDEAQIEAIAEFVADSSGS